MNCQIPQEAMDAKDLIYSRQKCSTSDTDTRFEDYMLNSSFKYSHHPNLDVEKAQGHSDSDNISPLKTTAQSSLKQEIIQLEEQLEEQLAVRHTLEKSLGYRSSAVDSSNNSLMPKTTMDLEREITMLELQVFHLEQHLRSLYRNAFDPKIPSSSPTATYHPSSQSGLVHNAPRLEASSERRLLHKSFSKGMNESPVFVFPEKLTGPTVYRSYSELVYRTFQSARISPLEDSLARALQSCHSQPLSLIEDGANASSRVTSLAEYLGTDIADHISDTPNRLSEGMVRCMSAIYCKLADPPLACHALPSPTSSLSATSALSPCYQGDMWSPRCRKEPNNDARLINRFRIEGLKEFSRPCNTMVEVPLISRDKRRLGDIKDMLQNYESLVCRLETADPHKLKNDEKIAFWINLHNALMMHAYLIYEIPRTNIKRSSLLVKAMCVVGGRSISVDVIQGLILGCHTHCPHQWLRTFISTKMKFKSGDEWQAYAISHPEPLLHFALSSGSYSDPAVRVYSSKKLFQQLEAAKEEYIRATVSIWKDQKILLPKVIDSYAKDIGISSQRLVDMIQCYLPGSLRFAVRRCQQRRSRKIIKWIPANFSFRYLLSKESAIPWIK